MESVYLGGHFGIRPIRTPLPLTPAHMARSPLTSLLPSQRAASAGVRQGEVGVCWCVLVVETSTLYIFLNSHNTYLFL